MSSEMDSPFHVSKLYVNGAYEDDNGDTTTQQSFSDDGQWEHQDQDVPSSSGYPQNSVASPPIKFPVQKQSTPATDDPVVSVREQKGLVSDVPVLIPVDPGKIPNGIVNNGFMGEGRVNFDPEANGSTYDFPMTTVYVKNLSKPSFNARVVLNVQNLNEKETKNQPSHKKQEQEHVCVLLLLNVLNVY